MDDAANFDSGEASDAAREGLEPAQEITDADRKLVSRLHKRIDADKAHHKDAYARMKKNRVIARYGAEKSWVEAKKYVANITGRHIRQMVSALYAKNPKAVARRRPRLDFLVWDEDEKTLMAALQVVQAFQASVAQAQMQAEQQANLNAAVSPMLPGVGGPPAPMMPPMMPPAVEQAMAVLQDFQQGMAERALIDKTGKTLEVLFEYYMREQKPLDFKTSMKQLVRRVQIDGAGFVEVCFQRAYAEAYAITSQIADAKERLQHIRVLQENLAKDGSDTSEKDEADARELQAAIESLQEQQYMLLREGLVYDFPETHRVIPDKRCRNLTGFVGARWVTIEYLYTVEEVQGLFKVDLGRQYTPYTQDGKSLTSDGHAAADMDGDGAELDQRGLVCVRKHFDRQAGVCYYLACGYKGFLRKPGPPEVYVEDFWPVYTLTFNELEDPECCWPPSDVELIQSMQEEHNRAREGNREHRRAARPRYVSIKGTFDDEDKEALAQAEAFSVTEINPQGDDFDVNKAVQVAPSANSLDPNLYETNPYFTDMQLVVGTSSSGMGATPRGETATGEAIAEDSRVASNDSQVDDLDAFLTVLARASGQIMLRELSPDTVTKIAGRGAVWPELSLEELAGEVYLEVEAGSSGKPNAAQEIRNWREMLPFLIQMPGIEPTWLARESLKRLDDRMDLTDALASGLPAIVSMNRMSQAGPEDPGAAPEAQGGEGAQKGAPKPQQPPGGERGMGNNRV